MCVLTRVFGVTEGYDKKTKVSKSMFFYEFEGAF